MKNKEKENNYCVIMAGGIGSRFWPLSTEKQPKQFLDIMGTGKSFIRATYERFLPVVPTENFLVVTSTMYKAQVLEHIPELDESQVLLEPMRKNTAPCIAYASFRIKSQCENANVVVTPADHLVTNTTEFQRIIDLGFNYVSKHNSILTIGIKPSRAETGYGYIQLGEQSLVNEVFNVENFKEKPNLEIAEKYVLRGDYMWNSGIFLWSNKTILAEFEKQLPLMFADFAKSNYGIEGKQTFINELIPNCKNISMDYGVMENAQNRAVIPADFGWSDIGTWGSLYTHLPKDKAKNTTVGANVVFENASNCVVNLPKGDNAIIQGLDGYLIAYHGGNLIVCKVEDEQEIKTWIEKI